MSDTDPELVKMLTIDQPEIQFILVCIRDCNMDHIGEHVITQAREELKRLFFCDDFTLNELLKVFVEFEVETKITFPGEKENGI